MARRVERRAMFEMNVRERARGPRAVGVSLVVHLVLLVLAAVTLVPFAWVICAAFKTPADQVAHQFLPGRLTDLTLDNFRTLLAGERFGEWMANSIFLATEYT
jgi:ABC-type glycerol-3-phosphate transport system permease component